jgi:predicted regulator of Ras-like GTPase activity (Roadblock/LC7/MglB family)
MKQNVDVAAELSWMLDALTRRVVQVRHVVVLSNDGLAIAWSSELGREDVEHLSALAAGFQSLARGAGRQFSGGTVRQTIVEMESAFLFVTAAGQGACLALLADEDANVGLIAYEVALLVKRVGNQLSVEARSPDPSGA